MRCSYALHPYAFLANGASSLSVCYNLVVIALLHSCLKGSNCLLCGVLTECGIASGRPVLAGLLLALATYISVFSVMLLLPAALLCRSKVACPSTAVLISNSDAGPACSLPVGVCGTACSLALFGARFLAIH
jgi:hypothetical protein